MEEVILQNVIQMITPTININKPGIILIRVDKITIT
jgi:hypothetical protein